MLGVLGGLLGTFLMDLAMVVTFLLAGQDWDLFFTMVGERFGDGAIAGILVHDMVGMTGGLVLALAVHLWDYKVDSIKKGLKIGIAAGALTIPLGCIPLAIWLNQPILDVIGFSLIPHFVWGTTLGAIVGYGSKS